MKCLPGTYMHGHNKAANTLTCCPYPANNRSTSWTLDGHGEPPRQLTLINDQGGTCHQTAMHFCPPNSVMEGVNADADYFLCAS